MLEGTPHTPHDTLPLRLPDRWTDGEMADDGPAPGGEGERGGSTPHRGRRRHAAGKRGGEGGSEGGGRGGGLQRSSLLMALGTVVSRATGLIRQVLQAAALGTGLLATTYNTANTVPTSLYTLLIGGALNSVLVPQLVRARTSTPTAAGPTSSAW